MEKGITILVDGKLVLFIHENSVSKFVEKLDSGECKLNWKEIVKTSKKSYKIKEF